MSGDPKTKKSLFEQPFGDLGDVRTPSIAFWKARRRLPGLFDITASFSLFLIL